MRGVYMRVVIASEIRLLGECVAHSLMTRDSALDVLLTGTIADLSDLMARGLRFDVAILDLTQGVDLDAVRAFHRRYPDLALLALGLEEQEQAVVAHGSAGFGCYVRREDGIERLYATVRDAIAGRMTCSPEIAGSIMRALFRAPGSASADPGHGRNATLTTREEEVARHVADALSNKEIALLLDLSESTVKHHVHSILSKLELPTRRQLIRRTRMFDMVTEPTRASS
ncbi:DNA-binding response regulator [Sphingomonas sp. S-NIH.Pt3_0716]|nr:DNA-binding response regulator [Sphingomonas sp. S-NIH.Pt3_0716]